MNYLYYSTNLIYPSDKYGYCPSELYPEYPFDTIEISLEHNAVYKAIREMFVSMRLDMENYGTKCWNPLGNWIKPGSNVVIKPNLVRHKNESSIYNGLDCLITHPSIIRCILDYCYIAVGHNGSIIIGDAPVKDCDFMYLLEKGHYNCITDFYNKKHINVAFLDFRGPEEGIRMSDTSSKGTLLNLGEKSLFWKDSSNKKLRVPNYNYKKVVQHHKGETQEYIINTKVLQADVIINLPKPKTHRKHGYTGSIKNFIGACYSKEYLPHHSEGTVAQGGDEFERYKLLLTSMSILKKRMDILDNILATHDVPKIVLIVLKLEYKLLWHIHHFLRTIYSNNISYKSAATEGAWHGNDTLWRTVNDVFYCINYGTDKGEIKKNKQRKILTLGDMIVSGEGEGPLSPSPKKQNMLLFSDDAVEFDCILLKIMGFDFNKFAGIKMLLDTAVFEGKTYNNITVTSNISSCNGKLYEVDVNMVNPPFKPAKGWKGFIEIKS